MKCTPCRGTGLGGSDQGTCFLCGGKGFLPDDPTLTETCNLCRGTGLGTNQYGFCVVCEGYGLLPSGNSQTTNSNTPFVFFVEAGQPRTAHLELAELFGDISGKIDICDPYFGTGSLLRLDLLKHCTPIRFLTKNLDQREVNTIPRAINEWKRQHGSIDIRSNNGSELHDRFILTNSELIMLGHGLKDVGNKDSFIVRIPTSMARGVVESVRKSFEQKWSKAISIN